MNSGKLDEFDTYFSDEDFIQNGASLADQGETTFGIRPVVSFLVFDPAFFKKDFDVYLDGYNKDDDLNTHK